MQAKIQSESGLSLAEKRALLASLLQEESAPSRVYPASFGQRRLWILDQLEGETPAYNLPVGIRLFGPLDLLALERSLSIIVGRHESLRTVFQVENGEPVQVVSAQLEARIQLLDLSQAAEPETEALRAAIAEVRVRFDLANGPLHRIRLIRFGPEDHILLVIMHHIITDGWSMGLFVRELTSLYDALSTGRAPELPDLPLQYTDFAQWQRERLRGDVLAKQIEYWTHRLVGAPPCLELPTDRSRPSEQSFEGVSQSAAIPGDLLAELRKLCGKLEATQFMIALATFKVLLHRYTGQPDLIVGIPAAGRNEIETEALIGFFVNTLAIRTNLSGNPRFSDVLIQVRDAVLGGLANQELPFEKLVEELRPVRSLSYHPVFQVMFANLKAPVQSGRFGNLKATPYVLPVTSSRFDLTMYLVEGAAGQWWVTIEYNTRLFDHSRISRMLQHYLILLRGIAADPHRSLADLPLLTEVEIKQFHDWNATQHEFPSECVHELFEKAAERSPDARAVVFQNKSVTYSELETLANQVAGSLIQQGVKPGELVGIFVERSIPMMAGLLGIWKAGAAYVPIDPEYPKDRIAYMLEDSGLSILLTQKSFAARVPPCSARLVFLDGTLEALTSHAVTFPRIDPESSAYVIYTSGSTGRPKAVCIPHRAVVNVLNSIRRVPGLRASDRVLAITTLSFDIAALELFLPLVTGAELIIAGREVVSDGGRLLEMLRDSGATVMQATPATWRLLIESGWQLPAQLKILCGGEALPRDLANELTKSSDSVWNLYGPTETTVWSAVSRVTPGDGIVTIGRPIDNTSFHVLDTWQKRVPVGVSGELYIGGAGLARGYYRLPELTESRFVSDPYGPGGGKLYRTGDIVRYLESGEIEYLGRNDSQVKVRGFRIELGEIEAVLASHRDVRQALAVIREDAPGDKRLVAYFIPAQEYTPDAGELRNYLRTKLPEYMVPTLVAIDQFPLTPSGKIDRVSLPAPGALGGARSQVGPRNQLERQLVTIWERLLRIQPIGIRDSFFDLGGHSLLAVRLIAEVRQLTGQKLPLSTLFHEATIEYMAKRLQESVPASRSSLIPLQTGGSRPPFFMGGSSPRYIDVARHLGPEQPVYKMDIYALQEQCTMAGVAPYTDVPVVAARFVADIKAVQPEGPYFLGGGCDFGVVALEVACQLQAEGNEIGLLLEWETPIRGIYYQTSRFKRVLYLAYRGVSTLFLGDLLRVLRYRMQILSPEERQHRQMAKMIWTNILAYSSEEVIRGAIHFIVANEQPPFCEDITAGWSELSTQGLMVHKVLGNHATFLATFVASFAETVGRVLTQAQNTTMTAARIATGAVP